MASDEQPSAGAGEIILYQTEDGQTRIDVRMAADTIWLSQRQMADLYQVDVRTVNEHIKGIISDGEVDSEATIRKYRIVQTEGSREVTRQVEHYSLDMILAIGYRVRSQRGAQFRRWATEVLTEYLRKGFAMNDDLLKKAGGGAYWKELLERIRDIRSSEKVIYRQVLDLYATSMDYDPKAPESQTFFKIVQNKLHYASHGHTAAELIAQRADADKPFMGLTTFEGEQPRRHEVGIAKNYMKEEELFTLNRIVSAFFEVAELRAIRREPMYMKDWIEEVDDFAQRYGQGVLEGAGNVSHEMAIAKAEAEYDKYRQRTAEELTAVERAYLDGIKQAQKQLEGKDEGGERQGGER